jgi:hypothetical protein
MALDTMALQPAALLARYRVACRGRRGGRLHRSTWNHQPGFRARIECVESVHFNLLPFPSVMPRYDAARER